MRLPGFVAIVAFSLGIGLPTPPSAAHPGGLNATMGDGSVRYMADTTDGVIVKWLIGADDGQIVNEI